jgi:DNA-binding beta-propeller fold protein YncE
VGWGSEFVRCDRRAVVTTIAGAAHAPGFADGDGSTARFAILSGLAVDPFGNIYVADTTNHTIRKITTDGRVSTVAGAAATAGGEDGTGSLARFNFPVGVAVGGNGAVYVADMGNNCVRVEVPAGGPVIEAQPTSQTVSNGSTVVFTAMAAGSPSVSMRP